MAWKRGARWFAERFAERGTWGGVLVAVCSLAGAQIAPERAEQITTLGVLIAGGILVAVKEQPRPPRRPFRRRKPGPPP